MGVRLWREPTGLAATGEYLLLPAPARFPAVTKKAGSLASFPLG